MSSNKIILITGNKSQCVIFLIRKQIRRHIRFTYLFENNIPGAFRVITEKILFFIISAVPGLFAILSLKKGHVGKHSQFAISDSFLFS